MAIDPPRYEVVGRGRWASRIKSILADEGRSVVTLEQSRRDISEEESAYRNRLRSAFQNSDAQIAWLCVPPGSHIPTMIEAAVESGLHVVVEKPWFCSPAQTHQLETLAHSSHKSIAIHYEYCLTSAVEKWHRECKGGTGLHFGGRLDIPRPDHIGLDVLDNLGSHLFSIHEYSVPESEIIQIHCAYLQPDDRRVWLEKNSERIAEIDLLGNKEPIIQRFIALFENAIRGGTFPFDLQFALRVAERTVRWRQQSRPENGR